MVRKPGWHSLRQAHDPRFIKTCLICILVQLKTDSLSNSLILQLPHPIPAGIALRVAWC